MTWHCRHVRSNGRRLALWSLLVSAACTDPALSDAETDSSPCAQIILEPPLEGLARLEIYMYAFPNGCQDGCDEQVEQVDRVIVVDAGPFPICYELDAGERAPDTSYWVDVQVDVEGVEYLEGDYRGVFRDLSAASPYMEADEEIYDFFAVELPELVVMRNDQL